MENKEGDPLAAVLFNKPTMARAWFSSQTGTSCTWVFEARQGRTVSVKRLQSSQEILTANILV